MTLLQAFVLGLVQGLSAFWPVSAVAHLRIVPALFGWHFYHGTTQDPGAPFVAAVQLGSTVALLLYFWREMVHVGVAWVRGLYDRSVRDSLESRVGWYVLVAAVPFIVLAIVFTDRLETGAHNLWLISTTMIFFALVLGGAELVGRRGRDEERLNGADAIAAGLAQVLALIPGASRTGTTISAGLFRGLDRVAAARFSFLLAIPVMVFSSIYTAVRAGDQHERSPGAGLVGLAVVVSFVAALASIHWLLRWLAHGGSYVFVAYRLAMGTLLIVLLATGVLEAT